MNRLTRVAWIMIGIAVLMYLIGYFSGWLTWPVKIGVITLFLYGKRPFALFWLYLTFSIGICGILCHIIRWCIEGDKVKVTEGKEE